MESEVGRVTSVAVKQRKKMSLGHCLSDILITHSPEPQGSEPPSEQVSSKLRSNLAML